MGEGIFVQLHAKEISVQGIILFGVIHPNMITYIIIGNT